MKISHAQAGRDCQSGFTLIEVLIAVLVLAIGMLGMAALQVTGLRANHSAYLRSQATNLAIDMADRMRANRVAVDNTNDPGSASDNRYAAVTGSDTQRADPGFNCASSFLSTQTSCTPAQMAQVDISQWLTALRQTLPSGTGTITCTDRITTDGDTCTTGSVHVIEITWDDNRNGVVDPVLDPDDPKFRFGFQP